MTGEKGKVEILGGTIDNERIRIMKSSDYNDLARISKELIDWAENGLSWNISEGTWSTEKIKEETDKFEKMVDRFKEVLQYGLGEDYVPYSFKAGRRQND